MLIDEKNQEVKWIELEELRWCHNKYLFNDFIDKNSGCTPKEIRIGTGLNRVTIYKYIGYYSKGNLIKKTPINKSQRKGVQYILSGTPELKAWLIGFKATLLNLYREIIQTDNNF